MSPFPIFLSANAGGAAAWSPADLAGAYLRCGPPAAGAVGSPLATWAGSVGGRDLTGPTGMTLRLEGSTRVLDLGANYNAFDVAGDPAETALSVHVFYKPPATPPGFNGVVSVAADRGIPFVGPAWEDGQGSTAYGFAAVFNIFGPNYAVDPTFYHLLSYVFDGAGGKVSGYVDGAEVGQTIGGVAANASVTLARIAVGGNAFVGPTGRVGWVDVSRAVHTKADHLALRNYLRAAYPDLWPPPADVVAWVANSLATETFSGPPNALPKLCAAGQSYRYYPAARGGHATPQLTALAADYGRLVEGATGERVAVLWEGTNDFVLNGASAAAAYANLVACRAALLAAGFTRVVVVTVIDRNVGGFDVFKAAINALIIDNAGGFDAVADLTGIAELSADGAHANATYFADGTHPTAAGNALAKVPIIAAVAGVL